LNNLPQGNTEAEENYWYKKVYNFEFEGWALGGMVSWKGGLHRVLKRILLLRDDDMLGGRRQWLHLLGGSQIIWAVALTAVQRSIQANTGSKFTVSFDTSSPFLWAGKFQQYPKPPRLTKEIRTWRFSNIKFPVGYAAATTNADRPFPAGSPLSDRLTIGDMNPNQSPYASYTFEKFSGHALGNHNAYVYIRAIIDANKKVFGDKTVPQAIADMVGLIDELFSCEKWTSLLKRKVAKLEGALQKSGSDADLDEEEAY
jgi:hypothetical protein